MRLLLLTSGAVLLVSQAVAEAYLPRPYGPAVLLGVALLTAGLLRGEVRA